MKVHCPNCGRFVGSIYAEVAGIDKEIKKVYGICSKCGKVDVSSEDWMYEDFFPEELSTLTSEEFIELLKESEEKVIQR